MKVMSWENGSYQFDPNARWPRTPLARLGVEAALIEVARRMDEQQRFHGTFQDPHPLIGVKDLPDADEHLSEDESELFGIIDGRHTVAEIVEEAPLTEYEAHEALHRMMEAGWIEVVGRRDPGVLPLDREPETAEESEDPLHTAPSRQVLTRELLIGLVTIAVTVAFTFAARPVRRTASDSRAPDVFAAAQVRDTRLALTLFHRERGHYPQQLEELAADGWIGRERLIQDGRPMRYSAAPDGQSYLLQSPER
jgi:hypothetical protein